MYWRLDMGSDSITTVADAASSFLVQAPSWTGALEGLKWLLPKT